MSREQKLIERSESVTLEVSHEFSPAGAFSVHIEPARGVRSVSVPPNLPHSIPWAPLFQAIWDEAVKQTRLAEGLEE